MGCLCDYIDIGTGVPRIAAETWPKQLLVLDRSLACLTRPESSFTRGAARCDILELANTLLSVLLKHQPALGRGSVAPKRKISAKRQIWNKSQVPHPKNSDYPEPRAPAASAENVGAIDVLLFQLPGR
jgi:hypothetical protein